MEDQDTNYCKICLVTDSKMFSSASINEAYSQLVQDFRSDYKLYVCYECKHLLNKCQEFRSKCMTALKVLSFINIDHSKITKRNIRDIDRKLFKLESKLSLSTLVSTTNNSNEQIAVPEPSLDFNIKIETDSDDLEDDKPEVKFDNDAGDPFSDSDVKQVETDTDDLEDDKPKVKFDSDAGDTFSDSDVKQDVDTDPDVLEDDKPEIKFDDLTNRDTQETGHPNEIYLPNHAPNDMVPEIKSKRKCLQKSMKIKETEPKEKKILKRTIAKRNSDEIPLSKRRCRKPSNSNYTMRMIQNYTTIDTMTPSQARNEMLLKKESKNYKTNPHKCDLCYKGFTLENTYNNHMKKHNSDFGTVECDFCHLFFRRRGELAPHIEGCHKYKIACKFCPYTCFSPFQAKGHIAIHKGESFTCELCEITFRYQSSLANHKRFKHPECVCAYCGSMFGSQMGLKIHNLRSHEKDRTELVGPKCEECDVQFATKTAWKRHLVFSSRHAVSNGCEECGESFITADELKSHAKEHPQRPAIKARYKLKSKKLAGPKCEECDIEFATEKERKRHLVLSSKHTVSNGCEECGATFLSAKKLENHVKKHSQRLIRKAKYAAQRFRPPGPCKTCGEWMKTHKEYNAHKKLEHPYRKAVKGGKRDGDQTQFICELCGQSFKNLPLLRYHRNKHTGVLPYECDECGKKYSLPSSLYNHKKAVHSGRRFLCDLCQKSYHTKERIARHMQMSHLGIRPHKCQLCDKGFLNRCDLKTHIECVHYKKPWRRRNKKHEEDIVPGHSE